MRALAVALVLLSVAVLLPAAEKPGAPEVWWSLKPLVRPTPPTATDAPRNPIDAFVLAKLREKGLKPSPEADRRTLLRRVTFDLTGLPPTPEQLKDFVADTSPEAYEKVVDRLLASPRHGERWARHWMDAVHFAETHGHDQDRPRPNAWPYRDYLIRSFNDDKPYPRFVKEQLAGDVLYPDDASAVAGLGMLAAGPWDESSLRDIREDTPDREIARYLDRDDMATTAMTTFVSLTVGCARCHDHKFDPISIKEYYGLQAVFAGVDKAERPFDADPAVQRQRRELTERVTKLRRLKGTTDPSLLTPEAQAVVTRWEAGSGAASSRWVTLDPADVTSAGGATLTKRPDHSILAGGTRPEKDTYTVTLSTDLKGLTALRLELLTDETLPVRGPGRQENGNLHLNEVRVRAGPKGDASAATPVPIRAATADFNQDGWTVAMAIDDKPATAWGIFPAVSKPHQAVFAFKEPVGFDGGTMFRVELEQSHGRHHLIGRFRLSVTTVREPGLAGALPEEVAAALAVPAAERSERQKAELALYVQEQQLTEELAALPAPRLVYAAASDFKPDGSFRPAGKPRVVHVLRRGDLNKAGDEAVPGALSCVSGLRHRFKLADANDEGARRAALADWVTHHDNPLTWRSIVNRVWHHHFGKGIVDTPNDLGKMGGRPSHPELLDWLAVEFRDGHQGSLKKLHRLIVTSATYRQASRHDARAAELDADNRLLWRMNRTRLDAESVRDAALQLSGKLDLTMYGPSVKQFVEKPGIHVTPLVDYAGFDVDRPENHRRSVYRFLFRTLPDPLMEALDCADSSQLTPVRNTSASALQALALWNNKFMVRQSEHLAERLKRTAPDTAGQVREAFRLVLLREPSAGEVKDLTAYVTKHGLANACRVLLNGNEFQFVD